MFFYEIEKVVFNQEKTYVIYGAGEAGAIISWYLDCCVKIDNYIFCDSNVEKQNCDATVPILAPELTVNLNAIYIVSFVNNDMDKINSVLYSLKELGVDFSKILLIDMSLEPYRELQYRYIDNYVKNKWNDRIMPKKITNVKRINFLSFGFTKKSEKEGGGGPIGALCMQKKHLGDQYRDINLRYPYYREKREVDNFGARYAFITEPINQVESILQQDQGKDVYIVNDMFSAFALAVHGKKYCLIYHGQGDIVQELCFWGVQLTEEDKKLIWDIEKKTIEMSYATLFPSEGAKKFFYAGMDKMIRYDKEKPVYNTIYDEPQSKVVQNIVRNEETITFLSVGQMTQLKGMDRIPEFLYELSKAGKKLRWIVVAGGVLKERIDDMMLNVQRKTGGRVEYINIPTRISHENIFYLMDISDVYIMLHRVSIFDFSTLEAMKKGKAIILSDIDGNKEFNREQNVLLINPNQKDNELVWEYIRQKKYYGQLNKKVYEEYFSSTPFIERYHELIDDLVYSVESEE